jgi:hypothetical protein
MPPLQRHQARPAAAWFFLRAPPVPRHDAQPGIEAKQMRADLAALPEQAGNQQRSEPMLVPLNVNRRGVSAPIGTIKPLKSKSWAG